VRSLSRVERVPGRTVGASSWYTKRAMRLRGSAGLCITAVVCLILFFSLARANGSSREDLSVEDLKARVSTSTVGERPHLCVQIAQKQLDEANKAYAGAEVEKAQAALTDVVAYTELARDYAIQSHKYQKQSEIAVREMSRKLTNLLHTLGHDDQGAVRDAVKRLERVSDDLLASMFKKGAK
jgi:hypothetical protein